MTNIVTTDIWTHCIVLPKLHHYHRYLQWNFIDILGWVSALLEWIITLFWNLLTVSRTYDKLGITTLRLSAKFGQHSLSWQTVKTLHALWECKVANRPMAIPLKLDSWCRLMLSVMTDRTGFCTQIQPAAVWYRNLFIFYVAYIWFVPSNTQLILVIVLVCIFLRAIWLCKCASFFSCRLPPPSVPKPLSSILKTKKHPLPFWRRK